MILNEQRASAELIEQIAKKAAQKPKKVAIDKAEKAAKKKQAKIEEVIQRAKASEQLLKNADRLQLIQDEETLADYIEGIRQAGVAAIDTETTGLNPMTDELVGVCLYAPNLKAAYIPLKHTDFEGNLLSGQLKPEVLAKHLNSIAGIRWVLHNAKFDARFLMNRLGVEISIHFDTALAGNYLNENEPHRLKELHAKYVSGESGADNFSDIFEDIQFNLIPIEVAYLYAAADALKTFELFQFQSAFLNPDDDECKVRGLEEAARFFHGVEMPLIEHIARMENNGVKIDIDYAKGLAESYKADIEAVEANIHAFIDLLDFSMLDPEKRGKLSKPVNLSSPLQLSILIYDVMQFKAIDKDKPRGTGADILQAFSESKRFGQFFINLLKHRELAKLLSTYIEKLPAVVNDATGRIHASFNQYGAKTGRFSSSEPNLQNIPASDKNIRKMFVADDGNVFISCDYSQQEPRVLAHVADDAGMIQAYADNKDLYSWIASEVYKKPYEECKEFRPDGTKNDAGKKMRNAMKSVVLGLMYGRGAAAIAEQLSISKAEAKRIVEMFFDTFESVASYIQRIRHQAKRLGYVQTVYGRKRRLPEIQLPLFEIQKSGMTLQAAESDYFIRRLTSCRFDEKEILKRQLEQQFGVRIIDNGGKIAEAERQSVNSIIQGTSADITKRAMLAIGRSQKLKQLGAFMILTVHDEIIIECPKASMIEASEEMTRLMIDAAKDSIKVPMKVDSEITERWYGEPMT